MARWQKMLILQALETLDESEEENKSEEVDDIENDLSWYESEPELDAQSVYYSEINVSDSESEGENDVVEEVLGTDGYLWQTTPKNARRTQRRNIVTGIPGPKGSGLKADTPLKSF